MKWVTRENIHFDRVITPWLILRFVDPRAEFLFVPWGREDDRPADAVPFAMPGVELSDHDAEGTTFDRVIKKYKLRGAGLEAMARMVRFGVANTLYDQPYPDGRLGQMAVGFKASLEGIMLTSLSDRQTIDRALPVMDGFHALLTIEDTMERHDAANPAPELGYGMRLTTFLSAVVPIVREEGATFDWQAPIEKDETFGALVRDLRANVARFVPARPG